VKWVFSDGTVYTDGKVRGTSQLADAIRQDVAEANAGYGVPVQVEARPWGPRYLDLADPQLVHEWLQAHAVRADVTITTAPEQEPIERLAPANDDDPPGAVY
jgi:hypothetical protein